jgi:hypothetical protein
MSKKHLYLPKVHAGAEIDEPVNNGLWEDKKKKILMAISRGIELDESSETRGVSSIPDIYARPLTFLGALTSAKHPLSNRTLQEWRGMLSLLALKKVKKDLDPLTVVPVTLNDEKFSIALKKLAPDPIRLQKTGPAYAYTDILLIKFGDIPLGAFSPSTLVYTAADYNEALKKDRFSLIDDDGYLKPPGPSQGLDQVKVWLESFYNEFNEHALTADHDEHHKYAGNINKLLREWLEEIDEELGIDSGRYEGAPNVKMATEPELLAGSPRFIAEYKIYQALLTPLVTDDSVAAGRYKSSYALDAARNASDFKEIIVIDERQLSYERALWPGLYPSQLGSNIGELKDKVFNKAWG